MSEARPELGLVRHGVIVFGRGQARRAKARFGTVSN